MTIPDHSVLRASQEGATICRAPGRRSQSVERARGTKSQRPAFASHQSHNTAQAHFHPADGAAPAAWMSVGFCGAAHTIYGQRIAVCRRLYVELWLRVKPI